MVSHLIQLSTKKVTLEIKKKSNHLTQKSSSPPFMVQVPVYRPEGREMVREFRGRDGLSPQFRPRSPHGVCRERGAAGR